MDLTCLIVADDLTGACDSAVQFVSAGRRVRVCLDLDQAGGPADVLAISTESRDTGLASFGETVRTLSLLNPLIVFKKIDSTLRGNVGPEVAAAQTAFGCGTAVVTPAFPALGRLVRGGYLQLAGDASFVPRELAACFRELPEISGYELRDAVCDADLDAIVAEGRSRSAKVLWAGSGGLAAALARSLGGPPPEGLTFAPTYPLFCLGSEHPVSLEQERRLIGMGAAWFEAHSATRNALAEALQRRPAVLRIQRGVTPAERIRELLDASPVPLTLCGGDTASLVCRALQVRAIDLRLEIAAGIPCGLIVGGPFDGMPVVTKSGGFGGPDALMQVADFFTCSPPSH